MRVKKIIEQKKFATSSGTQTSALQPTSPVSSCWGDATYTKT